jgi:predicted RNA-binding Zn-ribbon protein involved in translation (DUF1610 family)
MPEFVVHKCPICGNDMVKGTKNEGYDQNEKVWDLAHTGKGTTVSTSTSGANYSGISGVSGYTGASEKRVISLVPYECPKCHKKVSYRE